MKKRKPWCPMADVCSGGEFLEWVGPDISTSVFRLLDQPADLVRAAAVSRTWRRFVIENDFCKSICLRLFPEVGTVAAVAEVTRSAASPAVPVSDSERDYRVYSNLAGALVSASGNPSAACVLRCIGASSTDDFPTETMVHTLDEEDLIDFQPSYWSSSGADDPEEPENLTYRLNSDVCIVDEIRVHPYLAFFHDEYPIYASKAVRFRMGHYKLPRGSESFVSDEDENKMVNTDKKYMWTYTSPEFPMLEKNVLQSFKLPRPALCIGGVVMIELLGRIQKQASDDRYYICVGHVEVIGRSLLPLFMVDSSEPERYSILKYLPGAKDLSVEDIIQDDNKDSLEWQSLVARNVQMNRIAILDPRVGPAGFMHEEDVDGVSDDDPFE